MDGFLAAIVAGPASDLARGMAAKSFGAGDPDWADPDEAERICDAILYPLRTDCLDICEETADSYVPIFRTLHDGSLVTVDWAQGFRIGVEMRSRLWDELARVPKRQSLLHHHLTPSCQTGTKRSWLASAETPS